MTTRTLPFWRDPPCRRQQLTAVRPVRLPRSPLSRPAPRAAAPRPAPRPTRPPRSTARDPAGPARRIDQWRTDVSHRRASRSTSRRRLRGRPPAVGARPGRLRRLRRPVPHPSDTGASGTRRAAPATSRTRSTATPTSRSPPAARRSCTTSRWPASRSPNLRLSPDTLVEDLHRQDHLLGRPADHRTTTARTLPHEPITPVVRSDGSGATAQFTRWMEHTHQQRVGRLLPRGQRRHLRRLHRVLPAVRPHARRRTARTSWPATS